MKAVSLKRLREVGTSRPEGYVENVLSQGKIAGGFILLEDSIYSNLCNQYSSSARLSLGDKTRNLAKAGTRVIKAVAKREPIAASASEIDRRLAICRACEHFVDNPMKCRKCGCYLNLKTRLETEHCPIGKW